MNKGFITIPVLVYVAMGVIATAGAGYGVYKYQEVQQENADIRADLNEQRDREIERLRLELEALKVAQEKTATSTEESTDATTEVDEEPETKSTDTAVEPEIRTVVEERIVYIPQPAPTPEPDSIEITEASEEIEEVAQLESEEEVEGSIIPITVVRVGQTAYPDSYGGVYGSYGLTIRVSPQSEDIYIPMTTNDSLGTSQIGFLYEVTGQEFRGIQDSEVTECTNFNNNLCKFKVGQEKDMKITVWLFPDEGNSGNYSVNFKTVNYYEGDELKEFVVGRQTLPLNLFY